MALQDKVLKQLDYLIEQGKKVKPATIEPFDYDKVREVFSAEDYPQWVSQCEHFLVSLLGKDSSYLQRFKDYELVHNGRVLALLGVLKGVKQDYENGTLFDLKFIYVAEVFSDFLEMSQHLLNECRHDPAAMLIGAVLEDGLRKVCDKNSVAFAKGDQLTRLKDLLLSAGVFNALIGKQLEAWIKLRNYAAHGQFTEYTPDQVKDMHKGVSDFLANHL